MATFTADLLTELNNAKFKLHSQPDRSVHQEDMKRARVTYTWGSTEANGDGIDFEDLFPLPNCTLFPELCRVRVSASSTITHKLQKVTSGSATDLTAALSFSGTTATAYVAVAGAQPSWTAGDKLRILLTGAPTVTAGTVVTLDLVYSVKGR